MEKSQKAKVKKEKKPKDSGSFLLNLFNKYSVGTAIFTVLQILIIAALVLRFTYTELLGTMAVGPSQYDDKLYNYMQEVIDEHTAKDDGTFGGADIIQLRDKVDHMEVETNGKGSETRIKCSMYSGYFTATSTFTFGADFSLVSTEKNFSGLGEYLTHFWDDFWFQFWTTSLFRFVAAEVILMGSISIISIIIIWVRKKSVTQTAKAETKPSDVQSTSVSQATNITALRP